MTSILNITSNIYNNTSNNSALIRSIGLTSNVLVQISNRNQTTESQTVVLDFMKLVDLVLENSLDTLVTAQKNFNSSNK